MSSSRSRRNLHGRPVLRASKRGERRPLRRLALLAAESAAHAPHLDGDRGIGQPEQWAHDVLHLARMLGRGMDQHIIVLAGNGERHLAFEIEMLLPADAERAGEAARACRERRGGIAACEGVIGQDVASAVERIVDGDQRLLRRDLDLAERARRGARRRASRRPPRTPPGRRTRPCRRRTSDRRPSTGLTSFLPGNVGGGEHGDDAGRAAHRVEIDAARCAARRRRPPGRECSVPSRLAQVVDVERRCRRRGGLRNRARSAGRRRAARDRGPVITKRLHGHPRASRPHGSSGCGAADLDQRLAQQPLGDAQAIGRRWRAGR